MKDSKINAETKLSNTLLKVL